MAISSIPENRTTFTRSAILASSAAAAPQVENWPVVAACRLDDIHKMLDGLDNILGMLQQHAHGEPHEDCNPLLPKIEGVAGYCMELVETARTLSAMAQSDPDETGRCVDQLSGELAAFADLLYILVLAGEDHGEGVNDLRDPISSAWRYAQRIASTVRKLNEDWPSAQLAGGKAEG